jgi:hypothetical protein
MYKMHYLPRQARDKHRESTQKRGPVFSQMWTPIYSWYEWLPYKGKGLMVANRPWDNTYNVTDTIWATAHTTQFTERGWYYLGGSASALLPDAVKSLGKTGGSYVSLVSPGCTTSGVAGGVGSSAGTGCEVSVVIETVGASGPTPIEFTLLSSLAHPLKLSCWTTTRGAVFVKVRKRILCEPFVYKNDCFTKTGSGQT